MGVDVSGGHATQAQPAGEGLEHPVSGPVVDQEGALELDPEAVLAERFEQQPDARLVVDAVLGAAGQADEAVGVVAEDFEARPEPIGPVDEARVAGSPDRGCGHGRSSGDGRGWSSREPRRPAG